MPQDLPPVAIIPMHTPEEAIEELDMPSASWATGDYAEGNQERPIPVQRKASMRRKPRGTSIPSPSTARLIMIHSGSAALILASL